MPEVLWEIWHQKRNHHHRIALDFNETPGAVFQRIVQEFSNTDKVLPTTMMDPNTGKEVRILWDFSFRSRGKENRLQDNVPFAQQGVGDGALIVARARDIRAQTIYIDGTAGLIDEELRATRSKTPLILALLFVLLAGGGAYYYYYVHLPRERERAPHRLDVSTEPKGAEVSILLDLQGTPEGKQQRFQLQKFKSPSKNIPLVKKSRVVYISITKQGYKTWKLGYTQDEWEKDQQGAKKLKDILPTALSIPGTLPDDLDKLPPPPRFKVVPASAPKALTVQYPRRWKRFRVGFDPMHGGEDKGAKGMLDKTGSALALELANTVQDHLNKAKRRGYQVFLSRTADEDTEEKQRVRNLRRASAIIQLGYSTGHDEYKKATQTTKKDASIVHYNDAVAGFQVMVSKQGSSSAKAQKLAQCLVDAMKEAGFLPHSIGYDKPPADANATPLREFSGKSALLAGTIPAVRLLVGYLSHRAEEKILNAKETQQAVATAIESAIVCFNKR